MVDSDIKASDLLICTGLVIGRCENKVEREAHGENVTMDVLSSKDVPQTIIDSVSPMRCGAVNRQLHRLVRVICVLAQGRAAVWMEASDHNCQYARRRLEY